jgi:methionyl-tRNA synthetase
MAPYIPETSERIAAFLGNTPMDWSVLGTDSDDIRTIGKPEILFKQLEGDQIEGLRARFSGTQAERREEEERREQEEHDRLTRLPERFSAQIELRVAKITAIERHPKADKLYIETIDLGSEQRTIVSGLVPHYTEEELLGHHIIVVANLKPAKLRGVVSQGMLLAASDDSVVDVIFADSVPPGSRVVPAPAAAESMVGTSDSEDTHLPEIDIDTFFSMPIHAEGGRVLVGDAALEVSGVALKTSRVLDGKVG